MYICVKENIMEEIWRDIPDYEGFYQASNLGKIKALKRKVVWRNTLVIKPEKELKAFVSNKGYYITRLSKEGVGHTYSVARLIAYTFPDICGEYFEGAEIDHIDTNPLNNVAVNLRWVDRIGQMNNPLTKKHRSVSLKNRKDISKWVIKLTKNNEILHFYPSTMQAERETGISSSGISMCCSGKRKTAGGYTWKYAI